MKLDNLSAGMVVKNCKAMREVLDEEVRNAGKARQLQAEEWSGYFNFDKQGHKFIICCE